MEGTFDKGDADEDDANDGNREVDDEVIVGLAIIVEEDERDDQKHWDGFPEADAERFVDDCVDVDILL